MDVCSAGVSEKLRVEVMVEGDPAAYRGGCAPRSRARRRSLRIALPYANNEAAFWRSGCRTLKPRGRRSIGRSRLTENLSRCVRTRVRLPTNDSGEHARPACRVRRLANNGFPARRRKLHAGTRALPRNSYRPQRWRVAPAGVASPRQVYNQDCLRLWIVTILLGRCFK